MSTDNIRQMQELLNAASKPGVHCVEFLHDSDCPAIGTGEGCICSPELRVVDAKTFSRDIMQTRQQRRAAEREAIKALKKARKP